MNRAKSKKDVSQRAEDWEKELLFRYGLFVGGRDLRKLLGYKTAASFRNAAKHGCLPVPSLALPGRKGRHARVKDIAQWLAEIDLLMESANEVSQTTNAGGDRMSE